MTTSRMGLIAIAVGIAVVANAQVKVGERLPNFSVTGMDGKLFMNKDLQSGPTFLYFVRDGDSVSQETTTYINEMIQSYGPGRATWYGILNAREDRAKSFRAERSPGFRLVRDEDQSAVRVLGVTSAPTIIELGSRGRVAHVWHGLSATNLKEINGAFAAADHVNVKWMDFSKAPDLATFGTPYSTVTLNKNSGG